MSIVSGTPTHVIISHYTLLSAVSINLGTPVEKINSTEIKEKCPHLFVVNIIYHICIN